MVRRLSVLAVLLTACSVGEVPPNGDPGPGVDGSINSGGEASFQMIVAPKVTECVGCHAGLTPPNLSSFGELEAKYKQGPGATNILVTKGGLTGGIHQGLPYLTDPEQAEVAAWIDSL